MSSEKASIRWREPGLPSSLPSPRETPARQDPSGTFARTEPARVEVEDAADWTSARTVLGAPSFATLAAERAALAESDALAESEMEAATVVEASSFASVDIDIDIEIEGARDHEVLARESIRTAIRPIPLEVSIAPHSESAIWEGLDGELGVFLATYDELPLGTEAELTVHLTGERPFVVSATVAWIRNAPGLWPGLGLRLLATTPDVWFRVQRFSRKRAPLFHCP